MELQFKITTAGTGMGTLYILLKVTGNPVFEATGSNKYGEFTTIPNFFANFSESHWKSKKIDWEVRLSELLNPPAFCGSGRQTSAKVDSIRLNSAGEQK